MLLAVCATTLSACAHGTPVNDADTALAIGEKICEVEWAGWVQEHGLGMWVIEPERWHARLKEDQWEVWTDGKFAGLGVYIPRSGARPSHCEDILQPAFFNHSY